jgi:hypothetical protein
MGNRADRIYDATHNLRVVEKRLPKYFAAISETRLKVTATWGSVCQSPLTTTDVNGQAITNTYERQAEL